MKPHKKLIAWQKSMELVEKLYGLTDAFPREEIYGVKFAEPLSQFRRI